MEVSKLVEALKSGTITDAKAILKQIVKEKTDAHLNK